MRLIDADALKKEFPKDTDWEYPTNTNEYVCEKIDAQPTVQPEINCSEIPNNSDTISRQQAIDAVSNCGICIQRIVDLPSVQPEHKAVFNRDIAIEAICDEVMLRFDVSATQAYEIAETAVKRIEVRMEKMNRGEKDG